MAIINLDKFDIVLQKATELGVQSIQFRLSASGGIARALPRQGRAMAEIVFEAVKQSGRRSSPSSKNRKSSKRSSNAKG